VGETATIRIKTVTGLIQYTIRIGDHIANNGESLV